MNIENMNNLVIPNLIITKLVLLSTNRNYDGIYKRDYKIQLSSENLNNLTNIMHSNPCGIGYKLSSIQIADNLSNMIGYNTLGSTVSIPNGWEAKRCVFLMIVDSVDSFRRYYIQGYTDYDDPSMSGYMDPNMTFYINLIHSFTRCVNSFNVPILKHDYSYNILEDITNNNAYLFGDNTCNNLLVRPCDIYTGLSGRSSYDNTGVNDALYNPTAYYNAEPKASDVKNLDPVAYLEKTINNYITAKNVTRTSNANTMYVDDTALDVFMNASELVAETSVSSNPFIVAISIINNLASTTTFRFKDLSIIDPSLDVDSSGRLDYYTGNNPYTMNSDLTNPLLNVYQGESHLQSKVENMIANRIVNTVGVYMTETMITAFSFSFTNRTIGGVPSLVVTNVRTILDGVDEMAIKNFIGILQSKIETFIVPYLMSFGVGIMIHCQIELFIDSTITITYDNNPETVYVFPTFANGLFDSVITTKYGYDDMVSTVDMLTDKITEIRDDVMGTNLYSSLNTVDY